MIVVGALSSFRELGEMSPHKRACVYRFSSTYLTYQVSEIRRGILQNAPER
jgi:hypothetical protein